VSITIYEFYHKDDTKGYELVNIVEERRRDKDRITQESLVDLARKTFGKDADFNRIYLIQVEIEDGIKSIFENPYFRITGDNPLCASR